MKKSIFLFLGLSLISLVACGEDTDKHTDKKPQTTAKAPPVIVTEKAPPAAVTEKPATPEPKYTLKKVCKDSLNSKGHVIKNKDGTAKQTCKNIKIRKKYQGTPVPGQK